MTRLNVVVLSIIWTVLAGISAAAAVESSSDWISNKYTSSRLFVGRYDAVEKVIHMGWHIKLRDGWKTYWRTPGEAGMPPVWHWNNEGPLKEIEVLWPLPERMITFGYESNIYHDEIILPVDVHLTGEGGTVKLSLATDYMICKDVCIPLSATYMMDIADPSLLDISPYQAALLDKYRSLVPRTVDPVFLVVEDNGEGVLDVRLHPSHRNEKKYRDLFVEGPDAYYFSRPVRVSNEDGLLFKIPYTGEGRDESLAGREITLTLVPDSGQAVEVRARVTGK